AHVAPLETAPFRTRGPVHCPGHPRPAQSNRSSRNDLFFRFLQPCRRIPDGGGATGVVVVPAARAAVVPLARAVTPYGGAAARWASRRRPGVRVLRDRGRSHGGHCTDRRFTPLRSYRRHHAVTRRTDQCTRHPTERDRKSCELDE